MGKSADQLRDEIDAQRHDAGAKIDQLQHQVEDQIDNTRQQVTETAQQVTDTAHQVRDEAQAIVTDTVDTVKQTVQDIDIEGMVQQRPLVAVGAAVLGGFLLGTMLGGDDDSKRYSSTYSSEGNVGSTGRTGGGVGNSLRNAARDTGLEDTISNAGAAIVGSMTEQLKDMLDRSFPGFSDKLSNVQQQPGSFKDKANAAQQDAQRQ